MTTTHQGRLTWLGHTLTVAAPTPDWFERLTCFTGLPVEPLAATEIPPVLTVLDERQVLVDGHDLRRFPDRPNLEAWLFLTVSDVMVHRGSFTVVHAASFLTSSGAVLVSGPPWSGKSSWAFEAQRRGLRVLGDDQVRVDPESGEVTGLPRPLKRRVLTEADVARLSPAAVRARLEDEPIALEPLPPGRVGTLEDRYPVAAILHLTRHDGPGYSLTPLRGFDATRALLDQTRCYEVDFLATVGGAARRLARRPNWRLSVGDGEIGRAFDAVLALDPAAR